MDIYGKNEHRFDAIMDEYTDSNEYTQIMAEFSQRPVTDTKVNNLNINFSEPNGNSSDSGYANFSKANPNVPGTADVGPNMEATTTGLTLANSGSSGKVFDSYNKAFINKSNVAAHRNGGFLGPSNGLAATPITTNMSENVLDLYDDLADAEEFGEDYYDDYEDYADDPDDYDDYDDDYDLDDYSDDYDDLYDDYEDYGEGSPRTGDILRKPIAKAAASGNLVRRYVNGKPFKEARFPKDLKDYRVAGVSLSEDMDDDPLFLDNPNFSEDFYEFMVTN